MRLSVVIPVHNRPGPLAEQLEGLAGQRFAGVWEVIVADNGSTDATVSVAASFAGRLPLRVIDASARRGKPFAVNHAAVSARGESLILLDSDDVVAPGYLAAMAEALDGATFVGARLDVRLLNPAWLLARRPPLQGTGRPRWIDDRPMVGGAGMGVNRAAFLQVGGLDERLHCQEDLDLSWRLQDAGHHPHFVPDAVVHYRYRQGLRDIWRQERRYGRYEAALFAKHRPPALPTARRVRRAAAGWLQVLRAVPGAGAPAGRARLVTVVAAAVGRAEGSLRDRVLYL